MTKMPDYISTTEALDIIEGSVLSKRIVLPTLIAWAKRYNLGRKFGGRWYIDKDKLLAFLRNGGHNGA